MLLACTVSIPRFLACPARLASISIPYRRAGVFLSKQVKAAPSPKAGIKRRKFGIACQAASETFCFLGWEREKAKSGFAMRTHKKTFFEVVRGKGGVFLEG
jgi:hypothetical protein